ncbi:MAG: histidine kinase, partial [Candidatus Omnitrophica bacterium]|nr:histidine kinase [Candidatus Omnitrophota bacterium]
VINLTLLKNSHIEIQTKFDPHPIHIQADPQQLKQALLNLVLNAIDAMPNGGTLTVTTNVIPAKAGIQYHQYIIEISDTGCGIDPKDLPHIFDPFFSKKEKGTGLGLAITQGIIEKHGGIISVESKLNQGTNFKIKLMPA